MPRERTRTLEVGDRVADFSLESSYGEKVTMSDFRGGGPLLLIFFRGTW
ncbi:MAG: redoxin domain-containing protein [Chloroflexota bacterium]|nr:redoxin domain-containing protein [Chloroflexota bacterium]